MRLDWFLGKPLNFVTAIVLSCTNLFLPFLSGLYIMFSFNFSQFSRNIEYKRKKGNEFYIYFFDLNLTDRRFRISIVHVLLFIYSVFSSIIYYFRMHTLVSLSSFPKIIQYFRSDYTRKMLSFHGSYSLCFSFNNKRDDIVTSVLDFVHLQLTTNGKRKFYTLKKKYEERKIHSPFTYA